MYLISALVGHGESCAPASSGAPTECTHGTNSPSSPRQSSARWPMRVMIRIETTTYGESVSCTPICDLSEPSGPIENGTTYIVRPFIAPVNSSSIVLRISAGSRQLFVGPASSSRSEQMNVRSSTRATSLGSDHARYEFGRLASLRRLNVPASTSSWQRRSYSSAEPSHQTTWSGWVSSAISSTQASSFSLVVGTAVALTLCSAPEGLFMAGERGGSCQKYPSSGAGLRYSTFASGGGAAWPGFFRGTRTRRLNSATSVPSCLYTRVCTFTVPRSGFERDSFFSSTSDSTNSVSPWKTGAGWLSSSVARFAIAFPLTSLTLIPSASEYTSGPTTTFWPCWLWPAYTSLRCSGWWFIVIRQNRWSSASVTVLAGQCL